MASHDLLRNQISQKQLHLPLILNSQRTSLAERRELGSAGLGDYLDISYNVLVGVGGTYTPVLIDTGSSDLWVVGDFCGTDCGTSVSLVPHSDMNSTGLDVSLLYGDSGTVTYANGVIASGGVSLVEFQVLEQQYALINKTNAGVIESGASGILGLGFPANSVLWNTMFANRYLYSNASLGLKPRLAHSNQRSSSTSKSGSRQAHFPDLSFLDAYSAHTDQYSARGIETLSDKIFRSYHDIAPFLGRLITAKEIDPMFVVTLQRDTIEIGGNAGQLSIGGLPPGVQSDNLTWVPVRGYTQDQGGLPAPLDSPGEIYPIAWEIPIDDVYLDENLLPRSNLSSPNILLSALIDTGNSIIRGPEDVVREMNRRIGTSFPCSEPHNLTFLIGGKPFPVDPRDFLLQERSNSVAHCISNVAATDPPAVGGYLFSWSLGIPFLKGVISAFYVGDLEYPSRDPPRIGFLSTVPQNAGESLKVDVSSARAGAGSFPFSSESAPLQMTTSKTEVSEPTQNDLPTDQGPTSSSVSRAEVHTWLVFLVVQLLFIC